MSYKDCEKIKIIQHPSCQKSQTPIEGEPRKQTSTFTSDIGTYTQVVTWPNPVGSPNQGVQEITRTIENYTGEPCEDN
jgi:hypothetical protein